MTKKKQISLLSLFLPIMCVFCAVWALWPQSYTHVDRSHFLNNMVYTGNIGEGGYFEGKGTLTFPNKDVYTGFFKDGRFDNEGQYKSSQGWTYTGHFKNGRPIGKGTVTLPDGKKIQVEASR